MRSATAFALRRPRAALALWLVLVAVLGIAGRGVDGRLHPTDITVPGSPSAVAASLDGAQFGHPATLPILLTGPSHDVRAQGRRLAARLEGQRGVSVVSPWNAGANARALRPSAGHLLLLASVSGDVDKRSERVRDIARAGVHGPVRAHITGVALAAHDVGNASQRAVHRADLIALPVLLLVLLLVFRSAIAALIPVALGAGTVLASNGVLAMLAGPLKLDAFATALASMVGLALAVDYSLLVVTRLREERERADLREALARAVVPTSRTVVVAGAAIVLAMVLTALLSPTRPIMSAAVGVSSVAVLAMAGVALAVPGALLLAGRRIGGRAPSRRGWHAPTLALRRPRAAAAITTLGLLALALPALHLRTGAPDARELPHSSSARSDFEAIRAASGPGWGASFEVLAVARQGTMTTPARLAALARTEAELRRDPDVAEVFGPGAIAKDAAALRRAGRTLASQQHALRSTASRRDKSLNRLAGSVTSASSGVGALQNALGDAGRAASSLDRGSQGAAGGLDALRSGVARASAGSRALQEKIAGATSGRRALSAGAADARALADHLTSAVGRLVDQADQLPGVLSALGARIQRHVGAVSDAASTARDQRDAISGQLSTAQRALASGRQSLQTLAAAAAIAKAKDALSAHDVAGSLDTAASTLDADATDTTKLGTAIDVAQLHDLARQARRLSAGISSLGARVERFGGSVAQLEGGTGALNAAISRLTGGTHTLEDGIGALQRGIGGLQSGVRSGEQRSAALAAGLQSAGGAVDGLRTGAAGAAKGRRGGPRVGADVIDSGYFVLAALDGQAAADAGINVGHGGEAARIVVIPRTEPDDPRTEALYHRLQGAAAALGARTGTHAVVGGPAAVLRDYQDAMSSRFGAIVAVLALATALLLALLLRTVLVPLVGIVLNALCVGATLGVLALLFGGAHPVLGGPGHLDATALTAVFAVMFALSIDYQLFIVSRIREHVRAGAGTEEAIAGGMRSTARVVTGAAVSMIAVFASFALADVTSLRVFGVGLAVAVGLDATLVRLVLLPALLRILGRRAWWPMTAEARSGARPARTPLGAEAS